MPLGKAFFKPKGESNGRLQKTGLKKIRRALKGVAHKGVPIFALMHGRGLSAQGGQCRAFGAAR